MIELLQFENCERIKITDIDNDDYVGVVFDVTDIEDQSDLSQQEESITIYTEDKQYVEFFQSDIKSIEIIK